jgi:hypothetical protein
MTATPSSALASEPRFTLAAFIHFYCRARSEFKSARRTLGGLVKSEFLSKLILFGEASLRRRLTEFLAHYHSERPHQGKGNQLLFSAPASSQLRHSDRIQCHEPLGGLLKFYQRAA